MKRDQGVQIRMNVEDRQRLQALADKVHLPLSAMLRSWVLQRLDDVEQGHDDGPGMFEKAAAEGILAEDGSLLPCPECGRTDDCTCEPGINPLAGMRQREQAR